MRMVEIWKTARENFNNGEYLVDGAQVYMHLAIIRKLLKDGMEGDILEIGAHEGKTTQSLLKLAKEFDRKVVVVDPYNGEQQGNESVYQKFKINTKQFDNLEHIKKSSQGIDLGDRKFCYVFVDGLHTYKGALNDLRLAYKHLVDNGMCMLDDTETDEIFSTIEESDFKLLKRPDDFKYQYHYKSWQILKK